MRHGYIRLLLSERKSKGRTPSPKYEVNPLHSPISPINPLNTNGASFTPAIEDNNRINRTNRTLSDISHEPAAPIDPDVRTYAESVLSAALNHLDPNSGISGTSGSPPAAPIPARYSVINRAINGPPNWCVIAPDGSVGKRSYATEAEAQAEAQVCNAHAARAARIAHS